MLWCGLHKTEYQEGEHDGSLCPLKGGSWGWRGIKWEGVGERSTKCNTSFIAVIERLAWNIAHASIITLHSELQTKL